MTPLPLLTVVRLRTDDHRAEGVGAGAIATIVKVYDDGCEVEFSRPDGTTIALLTVGDDEVDAVPVEELSA